MASSNYHERVIGIDPQGHRRVFALTRLECSIEAEQYVKRRPDTGPLSGWKFVLERVRGEDIIDTIYNY